jgi:tRNA threonylcarbamoyladenosine biosynthesis protein TsaB
MLLAIDTATRTLGLALHDGESLIAEQNWRIGNNHNRLLAPSIQELLLHCDIPIESLSAIAVAAGPGSYTGLRIGVALAKGMAGAKNLPLIGVNTLDIIAAGQSFVNAKHRLLSILPAGRGRIVAGEYKVKKGHWEADSKPIITTWESLLGGIEGAYYLAGEIEDTGIAAIRAAQEAGAALILVEAAQRVRRAGVLAEEAWRRYHAGDKDDFLPAKLAPIYIHEPS